MKSHQPVVWVLSGHKAGDTSQMLALADALGWEYTVKQLVYRSTELFTNLFLGPSLTGIQQQQSSALSAPWPDLVITAGRRNEPVARWISRQSGNQAKIVHLGRPWAALDCYDLIITTPQYSLPDRENIFRIPLPLHHVSENMLTQWRQEWTEQLPTLPRPWWVVLLGGDSGQFVFNEEKGRRLGQWVNQQAKADKGAVFVSNSSRTPADAYEAFLSEITVPVYDYHWRRNATDNPYKGYLANADYLVVTGESISMMAEAAATGVPLFLFDLADCPEQMQLEKKSCRPWWLIPHNYRYKPLTYRLAQWFAPKRMRRDIALIQNYIVNSNYAAWVGQGVSNRRVQIEDGVELSVRRVRQLFE